MRAILLVELLLNLLLRALQAGRAKAAEKGLLLLDIPFSMEPSNKCATNRNLIAIA
jgi:hypothetical protein